MPLLFLTLASVAAAKSFNGAEESLNRMALEVPDEATKLHDYNSTSEDRIIGGSFAFKTDFPMAVRLT